MYQMFDPPVAKTTEELIAEALSRAEGSAQLHQQHTAQPPLDQVQPVQKQDQRYVPHDAYAGPHHADLDAPAVPNYEVPESNTCILARVLSLMPSLNLHMISRRITPIQANRVITINLKNSLSSHKNSTRRATLLHKLKNTTTLLRTTLRNGEQTEEADMEHRPRVQRLWNLS